MAWTMVDYSTHIFRVPEDPGTLTLVNVCDKCGCIPLDDSSGGLPRAMARSRYGGAQR